MEKKMNIRSNRTFLVKMGCLALMLIVMNGMVKKIKNMNKYIYYNTNFIPFIPFLFIPIKHNTNIFKISFQINEKLKYNIKIQLNFILTF